MIKKKEKKNSQRCKQGSVLGKVRFFLGGGEGWGLRGEGHQ